MCHLNYVSAYIWSFIIASGCIMKKTYDPLDRMSCMKTYNSLLLGWYFWLWLNNNPICFLIFCLILVVYADRLAGCHQFRKTLKTLHGMIYYWDASPVAIVLLWLEGLTIIFFVNHTVVKEWRLDLSPTLRANFSG